MMIVGLSKAKSATKLLYILQFAMSGLQNQMNILQLQLISLSKVTIYTENSTLRGILSLF